MNGEGSAKHQFGALGICLVNWPFWSSALRFMESSTTRESRIDALNGWKNPSKNQGWSRLLLFGNRTRAAFYKNLGLAQ